MLQCSNILIEEYLVGDCYGWENREKTLAQPIHCKGIGIHSGKDVTLTLEPADAGAGICFQRDDMRSGDNGDNIIQARWDNVEFTTLCTEISNGFNAVAATIEHIMSALAGLNIDNVLVRVDGPEMPIMDGSANDFVFLIQSAGIVAQSQKRKFIKVMRRVEVSYNGSTAKLLPSDDWNFKLNMRINFPETAIGEQNFTYVVGDDYGHEIAKARTYGFISELEILRNSGLAKGACYGNAIAIDGYQILNSGGLHYENEFVRHKILDAIGDLYLAGQPLIADFYGDCSGHKLNNELLHELFSSTDNWQSVTFPE